MANENDYVTLRDYARLLWARRWLIVGITVAAVGFTYLVSRNRPAVYTATATLQAQVQTNLGSLVGQASSVTETPDVIAQRSATTLLSAQTLRAAGRLLRRDPAGIRAHVDVSVSQSSSLLLVRARGSTAKEAADLANVIATTAVAQQQQTAQDSYARAAARLRAQLSRNPKGGDAGLRAMLAQQLAEIETLAAVAEPLVALGSAPVPVGPSSPHPLRASVVAGALALIVAVLLAVLLSNLDQRLRRVEDIERELGAPLVGITSAAALGHAGDIVDGRGSLSTGDAEAFRQIRTNVDYLRPASVGPPRVILVTSALQAWLSPTPPPNTERSSWNAICVGHVSPTG